MLLKWSLTLWRIQNLIFSALAHFVTILLATAAVDHNANNDQNKEAAHTRADDHPQGNRVGGAGERIGSLRPSPVTDVGALEGVVGAEGQTDALVVVSVVVLKQGLVHREEHAAQD